MYTLEENLKVEGFLTEAKKIILNECSSFLNNDNLEGHRTFLHRLSKRRVRDPRLKIFTTNYDLCFERAASLQGLIILDGFSFVNPRRYDPNYFNCDIVRRTNSHDKTTNFLEGVFQLFKLHGSVNWERNGSEIIEIDEPNPKKACIIYPAHGKYQQSYIQPHLELFSRYLSSLREPNTCLIISGFGFNDDHLAEPVISAIDTNPHLKVVIADQFAEKQLEADKPSKYWEKLKEKALAGEDIWFINASFQKFAQLIPNLKALTSAQQLERTIKDISS
ncbi:SIR2 family protein [Halalkalibaculum sp. DA384]|uniref:SIR2 family protein n=1 Tax=Halalkalibaculum sp. DA384 TaxID=3373606 RepID=UPI003754D7B2